MVDKRHTRKKSNPEDVKVRRAYTRGLADGKRDLPPAEATDAYLRGYLEGLVKGLEGTKAGCPHCGRLQYDGLCYDGLCCNKAKCKTCNPRK